MRALLLVPLLLAGCARTAPAPPRLCAAVTDGDAMWIPAGAVVLGEGARYPEEGPPRRVEVPGFWLSTHEVTNREFARFVAATSYRTAAERTPPVTPQTPPEMRLAGSAVFATPDDRDERWWRWRPGAQWRRPEGSGAQAPTDAEPVVQVAYADALAYARWRGVALPTEAQWERAARLGGADPEYTPAGKPAVANIWQGPFPARDLGTDGYAGRAPVGCFGRDRAGLYDMIGNVWEWTADAADAAGARGVIKGGSYLCAANYCARYRPAARQFQERGLGTDHIGFRVIEIRRPPPKGPRA